MAEIEVGSYYSRWDLDDHVGRIQLYDTGNTLLFSRTPIVLRNF